MLPNWNKCLVAEIKFSFRDPITLFKMWYCRVDKGNFYLSNQVLVSFGEHLVWSVLTVQSILVLYSLLITQHITDKLKIITHTCHRPVRWPSCGLLVALLPESLVQILSCREVSLWRRPYVDPSSSASAFGFGLSTDKARPFRWWLTAARSFFCLRLSCRRCSRRGHGPSMSGLGPAYTSRPANECRWPCDWIWRACPASIRRWITGINRDTLGRPISNLYVHIVQGLGSWYKFSIMQTKVLGIVYTYTREPTT